MRSWIAILTLAVCGTLLCPGRVSAQRDGPSVCQYRDGSILNVRGLPCPPQPYWTRGG
jgi:hypothetical protein